MSISLHDESYRLSYGLRERTKKEVRRHKYRWISKKIRWTQINDDAYKKTRIVGSKGSRLKRKAGGAVQVGGRSAFPRNAYQERST